MNTEAIGENVPIENVTYYRCDFGDGEEGSLVEITIGGRVIQVILCPEHMSAPLSEISEVGRPIRGKKPAPLARRRDTSPERLRTLHRPNPWEEEEGKDGGRKT